MTFQSGDRVVIRTNPHHGPDGQDIVGTVTRSEPGAGFMRCDLVYVSYEIPRDGSRHEMPFATYNVDRGDRDALLARAARHEEQAAKLRAMAAGLDQ